MKKHIYLLLPLLTLNPTLATQNKSSFFSRVLVGIGLSALINNKANHDGRKKHPFELYNLDEKQILNLILNNSLRKAKTKKHLPSELRGLIHTFFIHEWTIHGFHKDTGTTYDPHDFDINGIHKQTQTILDFRGFTQNGDYKDLDPTTNKPTKYDPQGYNIDRWNKDGLHQNGTKVNNQGFAQHVGYASIHLYKAIDNLDKRALTLLLKNPNINVNLPTKNGWTPLIMCSWKGDETFKIAQALLEHENINLNLQNNYGCTPLIMCCDKGKQSLHIAQELLKHQDINVNLQEENGWTPLLVCCQTGDDALHIAQDLLKHQHINVNLQNNDGFTPLIECAWKGDDALQIAQDLLKHKHINVNLPTKKGTTPLIMCCQTGDKSLHIAQELLKHQHINVNLPTKKGTTPLIMCCQTGDDALHIAQALLKHQHINLQQKDGYTPLDIIIYCIKNNKEDYKYVQLWKLLVEQGGILDKCKADYENLKPSDFNEPHKGYVRLIKQNPPKN